MGSWRRKGDSCNQDSLRTNSYNHHKKPPIGGCKNWQQKIPYWEKRFVSSVGSLPWNEFVETKKFTYLYDNIMKWDDSAAELAFRIAKDRFFAKFHDLPCDVEPQNPDLYIDKIDWNAQVDYDLIQDLESEPTGQDDAHHHEPVVIFEDVLPDPYKDYSPYGWGDSDDKIKKCWGVSDDIKGDQNGINWDDYIDDNGGIIWDDCGVGGGNDWWAWDENDNKAGDQGWYTNKNMYDENNNYYYYASYRNVNNETHKTWRNKGNGKKSTGQGYGNRRGYGSTLQAHGSQHICVGPSR